MELWQALLLMFGGNAVLLVVLGWLARSLGSQILAKDLEKFKHSLSAASAEASERLKHELQLVAHEHQVRFSKLHERRAEVIESLYALLVEAQWAGESFASVAEFAGEASKPEKYTKAMKAFAEFFRAFDKSRIFLPEQVCRQLDDFLVGMRKRVIHFGVYLDVNEHAPAHVTKEKYEAWSAASEYFSSELPTARKALEVELRRMLAASPASVT